MAGDGSVLGILGRLEASGFEGRFVVQPGGRLSCSACGLVSPPGDIALREAARVDVVTDPDDQSVVAALECSRCHARGTYVFAYGPSASADEAEAFHGLRDARGTPPPG